MESSRIGKLMIGMISFLSLYYIEEKKKETIMYGGWHDENAGMVMAQHDGNAASIVNSMKGHGSSRSMATVSRRHYTCCQLFYH